MYLPFLKDKKFLYMGLNRLDESGWFEPDAEWLEFFEHKQRVFRERPDHCLRTLPHAAEAEQELQQQILANLRTHHDQTFAVSDQSVRHRETGHTIANGSCCDEGSSMIRQSSLLVQDDLCLLQASPEGYRLTAASLCSPSYWHLEDKIGQTLDEIHRPLPGYDRQLADPVNRFFARMKVNRPVWRANWSVVAHSGLMQRLDTPTPGNTETDPLWVRVERQTLTRLPRTQAICFTIRIHRYPLDDVFRQPGAKEALSDAMSGMNAAEKNYKSLNTVQSRLNTLLNNP